MVNVIGYYVDSGVDVGKARTKDVFLVFENSCIRGEKWLEIYAPIGQHVGKIDPEYLNKCTQIKEEDYLRITAGFYTPKEYLSE